MCNESLMSSDPLQTMKTNFKPLKFPALVKCIDQKKKKIHKEGNKWLLITRDKLEEKSGRYYLA